GTKPFLHQNLIRTGGTIHDCKQTCDLGLRDGNALWLPCPCQFLGQLNPAEPLVTHMESQNVVQFRSDLSRPIDCPVYKTLRPYLRHIARLQHSLGIINSPPTSLFQSVNLCSRRRLSRLRVDDSDHLIIIPPRIIPKSQHDEQIIHIL
ncbi:unnamed protein product, partial [Linum tenue]